MLGIFRSITNFFGFPMLSTVIRNKLNLELLYNNNNCKCFRGCPFRVEHLSNIEP